MPWVMNEDLAVKNKVSGLKVIDTNAPSGRSVGSRFLDPDYELAQFTFPMVIIERQSLGIDHEREHRGNTTLMYTPESVMSVNGWNPLVEDYDTSPYTVDYPIPYNLDYAIRLYTRNQQHTMQLVPQLAMQDRLPARFGFVDIPQDGTVRSLFLENGPEFEYTKGPDGDRLFITHYLIRVATEMPPNIPPEVAALWTSTDLNINITDPETNEVSNLNKGA